ncbi:CDP-diacylglycerol--glycerol-3-phosphate 3-phosphatidyltransferase [Balneolaceae bacterium ANBcel3]|nr:CDP-diacylglycerol--glycerol-3-phosphate 3-phosphatidyltransferase [Balneolaceae bacterium ANBcel3]
MKKRVPNILSASRILLAPLFVLLYLQQTFLWTSVALAIFIVAAITDYLDGYYARRYNVQSKSGIFLDPLADKFLTFAGFFCLPLLDPQQFPWWILFVIVFRDFFVTGLRIWADRRNITMETRYSAKVKTLVQLIFLYVILAFGVLVHANGIAGEVSQALFDSGLPGWGFIIVMLVTVYTGLEYIYYNRRLFSGD